MLKVAAVVVVVAVAVVGSTAHIDYIVVAGAEVCTRTAGRCCLDADRYRQQERA